MNIDAKIDKLVDKVDSIDRTLVRNTVTLEEHVRRTSMLEDKLVPIEKHVSMVQGAIKLLAILIACIELWRMLR
jgi:hypothetical protein